MNQFLILFTSLVCSFVESELSLHKLPENKTENIQLVVLSGDGGKTWADFTEGLPRAANIDFMYANEKEIYVVLDRIHLYRSINGQTWKKENLNPFIELAGRDILYKEENYCLGIFEGEKSPYISFHNTGVFQKDNNGKWAKVFSDFPVKNIYSIVEAEDGSIIISAEGGIFKRRSNGTIWTPVLDAQWATNLSADGKTVIASTLNSFWVSTDSGDSWKKVLYEKSCDFTGYVFNQKIFVVKDVIPGLELIDSLTMSKVFQSTDFGNTWIPINTGVLQVSKIHQLLPFGNYIFSSNSEGIGKSNDHGYNWDKVFDKPAGDDFIQWKLAGQGDAIYAARVWRGC